MSFRHHKLHSIRRTDPLLSVYVVPKLLLKPELLRGIQRRFRMQETMLTIISSLDPQSQVPSIAQIGRQPRALYHQTEASQT